MIDVEICTTSDKLSSFELGPICGDPLGYAEFEYDTLQELDYYVPSDVYHWHCVHPLGEGIDGNE
jgi:hypothetical protein